MSEQIEDQEMFSSTLRPFSLSPTTGAVGEAAVDGKIAISKLFYIALLTVERELSSGALHEMSRKIKHKTIN